MVQNKLVRYEHKGLKSTMTLAALALFLSILACSTSLPGNPPPKNSTDVALSVEATINAETVGTLQAQETQIASGIVPTQSEDPGVSATIQSQQATMDAQATSLLPQATQPPATEIPLVATSAATSSRATRSARDQRLEDVFLGASHFRLQVVRYRLLEIGG